MNEELMFERVRELCVEIGGRVDEIAHECNINQMLVSKMVIATFGLILEMMEEDDKNAEKYPLQ